MCYNFFFSLGELSDPYQLRGGVYFVSSLAMTASGKFLRKLNRDKALELYQEKLKMGPIKY